MKFISIAAAAVVLLGAAAVAQAQTQTGTQTGVTTEAPDQNAAQPAAPTPLSAAKKKPLHLLSPDEIKTMFGTGKPFAATSPAGKVIMITLKADGTATAVPKGAKKGGKKGSWRTDTSGYCSTWDKSTEHCYQIRAGSKDYQVETATGTVVAHWAKP